jgi:hypothetical protein
MTTKEGPISTVGGSGSEGDMYYVTHPSFAVTTIGNITTAFTIDRVESVVPYWLFLGKKK